MAAHRARARAAAALAAAIMAGLVSPRLCSAALGEEIPTGHPIYALLRRLETAEGLLPLHSRTEPLTRGDVARALDATEGRPGGRAGGAWVAALRAEIRQELALAPRAAPPGADARAPEARGAGAGVASPRAPAEMTARAGLRSRLEIDAGGRSRLRETLRGEAALDATPWLSLFESFEVDTHGERDDDFVGRRWRDAITGRVDRAGIRVATGGAEILAGRSSSRWGIGEPGGLILSPTSPPLDLVRLHLDVGPVRLASLAASLDPYATPPASGSGPAATENRRIAAHRLDLRFPPALGIGLSETVIYGGEGRASEPGYMLPILPFYAEQWNRRRSDNIFWGADFAWTPRPGVLLQGELLLDDFQYDLKTEPHQIGWTVGGEWAPARGRAHTIVGLEYTRIETFVYGHFHARNRYLHEGALLGHPLGPDSDRLAGAVTWDASEDATLALTVSRERHGAQRVETPQEMRANPHGIAFPSPPVRRGFRAELAGSWRPRVTRRIDASIAYDDDGDGRTGFSGLVSLLMRFDRLLEVPGG
jgi:hypothetical protein